MSESCQQFENNLNILVVDDEANIRKTMNICLESYGNQVTAVSNIHDAEAEARRQVFDLAFVDLRLGTDNGMDLIPVLLNASPWLKIVVITAYATIDTAVEAMRRGATDYLQKPFNPEQLLLVASRVADMRRMEQRIAILQEDIDRSNPAGFFNSSHPEMQRTIEIARQVAASEAVVMLLGPSGTGKTVLARAIHGWSKRAGKPLGVISCPSLSSQLLESELFGHVKGAFTGAVRDNPGRIAACEKGTIFLDEIGAIPLSIQPKLLRFIQEREYERVGDHQTRRADVRIISATNEDLEQAVKEGRFREDLYYRLNVIQIKIPPLCERPDDIEAIAGNMLAFFGAQNHKKFTGFTGDAILALKNYGWPGNLRELRNVIERAAILCQNEYIGTENLPEAMAPRNVMAELGGMISLEKIEEAHIRRVIAAVKSLHEAADILGIDQATLWRKRKQYGV